MFNNDEVNNELREAQYTGSIWSFEILDGAGGPAGRTTDSVGVSAAAIKDGAKTRVFYENLTDGTLRHTWFG